MNSLIVNLGDIPPEGLLLKLDISALDMAAILKESGDVPVLLSPLCGDLTLSKRAGGRLSIRGGFKVGAEMICDRCLAETPAGLSGSVDEVLDLEDGPKSAGNEDSESDGGLNVTDGRADLTGLLREWFWVAWPPRFICRPDCAGLCQRCGANLNEGPCSCLSDAD